jgi:acyl-CoA synthetase (AMP-forming)/AMP-acid ligase II
MNFATLMPSDLPHATYERTTLVEEVPPVGYAVDGCEVSVLDSTGQPVPDGTVGEVGVRGHSLMSGYLGDETATKDALRGGWLHTGDLGRFSPPEAGSQTWLTLVGRLKNVAKCGGISISLEELDRWIDDLDCVREAACVIRPDARRGEAVTVYYVSRPGTMLQASDITSHVSRRFDISLLGLVAVKVNALPRLRSGKIDRRTLMVRTHSTTVPRRAVEASSSIGISAGQATEPPAPSPPGR